MLRPRAPPTRARATRRRTRTRRNCTTTEPRVRPGRPPPVPCARLQRGAAAPGAEGRLDRLQERPLRRLARDVRRGHHVHDGLVAGGHQRVLRRRRRMRRKGTRRSGSEMTRALRRRSTIRLLARATRAGRGDHDAHQRPHREPTVPTPDDNTLYAIYLPTTTDFNGGGSGCTQGFEGSHAQGRTRRKPTPTR